MEVIKRTVNMKERDYVLPIDVVQCESMIAIQITVSDMTIPSGTLAIAAVLNDDTSTWTGNATVDGQTVTVEPDTKTFGYPGRSVLQIQFTSGDLNGFSFPIPVNVAKNIMEVDDNPSTAGLIAEQVESLVAQKMGSYAKKTDIEGVTNSAQTATKGYVLKATNTGVEWAEEEDPTVPDWAKAKTKPSYTPSEVGAIASSARGTANGVASLGADGKVPSDQLPDISSGMYVNVADYVATYGWTIKAINAAIADCPRHGTVFVPIPDNDSRQYGDDLTGAFVNITIDKPMTLLGEYTGWHWVNIETSEFKNALIETNYTGEAVIDVKAAGVSIKNISIKCPYAANGINIQCQELSDGTFEPAKYHIIENCSVYPADGGTGFRIDGGIMSKFIRCLAYGGKYGYVVTSYNSHPSTSLVFDNCWSSQYFDTAYYLNDASYCTLISCGADCVIPTNDDGSTGIRGYQFENCRGIQCIGCGCEFAIYCVTFHGCRECSFGGTIIPRFFSTGNYSVWIDSYTDGDGTVWTSDVVLSPLHYDGSLITNADYTPILCNTGSKVALLGTSFPRISDQGALKTPGIVYYTGQV